MKKVGFLYSKVLDVSHGKWKVVQVILKMIQKSDNSEVAQARNMSIGVVA